jgi:hypothetical protein
MSSMLPFYIGWGITAGIRTGEQPIKLEKLSPRTLFIVFLAGRHLCFYGAGGQKALHCILQLSKCPPADAHVCGTMETKMAAGWEYDE